MGVLHVVPTSSAAGSMLQAVRDTGRDGAVLGFRDDLSCGPIASDDAAARAAWWDAFYDGSEVERALEDFWRRLTTTQEQLVIWFSRRHAGELAFYLAATYWLGDRPFEVIDTTDLPVPSRDGGMQTIAYTSIMQPNQLASLMPCAASITPHERQLSADRWRQLKDENAPFRIVTDAGLVSAPLDRFDASILQRVDRDWRGAARLVADVMGAFEPYRQVGDVMVFARLDALVQQGLLETDGDAQDMHSLRVRQPQFMVNAI